MEAWFASGGSLRATGEALHVHPNTVAQRIDRVDRLLGADWREPTRSLDIQLALVRSISQEVAVMNDGRIVEYGLVDAVLEDPQADYTKKLLSDTPTV